MVIRLFGYSLRYISNLSTSKINMNLNKCYFRHLQNEKEIHITFLFSVSESKTRQFNFIRKPDDALNVILLRIGANIQKVFNKINKKKKTNKEEIKEDNIKIYDEANNIFPTTITCEELIAKHYPVKMEIIDQLYEIVYNSPWATSISLPQCILAGFAVHPTNISIKFGTKEHSKFNWYSSIAVNDKGNKICERDLKWEYVSTGFTYIPTSQEIGKKIKLECVPGNESDVGPAVEVTASDVVEAGPGRCPFENRHLFTTSRLKDRSFRCVTYNILADLYCDSEFTRTVLHPYCPPYALHIDYRKQLILKEFLGYNADIACLQEVDSKIFNHVLTPILENYSFDGVFTKKGKEVSEGLALFYRADRFKLLSHSSIVLATALQSDPCLVSIWNAIKDNEPVLKTFCNRSTVLSGTVLQSIENPNNVLVVGNTHLYFHPDADHIRLLQGATVIFWLKGLLTETKLKMPTSQVSLIICGDFNSVPSCGVYRLYTEGMAPSDLPDWKSNEQEIVTGFTLQQDVPLRSACGTPKYTNFTAGFADCLDYIFYDSDNLQVEQVIPLPSEEELTANTALPSIVFPSDHIALIADLAFKM